MKRIGGFANLYRRSIFLFLIQTFTLFCKNVFNWIHNIFQTLFQVLVPSVLLLVIYVIETKVKTGEMVSRTVSDDLPRNRIVLYQVKGLYNDIPTLLSETVQEMSNLAGYNFVPPSTHYVESNFTKCPKNSFCFLKTSSIFDFPPVDIFQNEIVVGTVLLTYDGSEDRIDYSLLKNITTGSSNPFIITSSAPQLEIYDNSLEFQSLFYRALYKVQTKKTLNLDLSYTEYVLSYNDATQAQSSMVESIMFEIIYICIFISTVLVHFKINSERNKKLIHGLTLNGMEGSSYWCSWIISEGLLLAVSIGLFILFGVLLKFQLFKNVGVFSLFIIFYAFSFSVLSCWFCNSTLCSGMLCTVIWAFVICYFSAGFLALFMINASSFYVFISNPVIFLVQINPIVNFAKLMWEIQLKKKSSGHFFFWDFFDVFIWSKEADYGVLPAVPPIVSLILIVAHTLLILFLTWYLDKVIPSSDKSSRAIWFLFSPKYWGFVEGNDRAAVDTAIHDDGKVGSIIPDLDSDIYNEYQTLMKSISTERAIEIRRKKGEQIDPEEENEEMPLKIVKISKTFTSLFRRSKSCIALKGVSMCSRKNEVFVVLGHNGAGKTTLINILNGTIHSSTGDCLIFGKSVQANMDQIRNFMGVCPQFDIIFDGLTVLQHLWLFAALKGLSILDPQIDELLDYLELRNLRHQKASNCSGGEKRRLTFASAVLGNPKIIFLDEPTSGLDPVRKKKVWSYIERIKKDRIIVLTTHSMVEADTIGDKIAFLALGGIRAIGNSSHLKNRFGFGYQLDISLVQEREGKGKVGEGENFDEYIQKTINFKESLFNICHKLVLQNETSGVLSFSMPFHLNKEKKLEIFRFIEEEKEKGIVKNYGLSQTTLEEVFMNVTHGNKLMMKGIQQSQNEMNSLGVCLENEGQSFATLEIGLGDTLMDVRDVIQKQYSSIIGNNDFYFLSKGNLVLKQKEKERMASSYCPAIFIRLYAANNVDMGKQEQSILSQNNGKREEEIVIQENNNKELMDKIKEKDHYIEEQQRKMEEMMEMIRKLQEQVNKKQKKEDDDQKE